MRIKEQIKKYIVQVNGRHYFENYKNQVSKLDVFWATICIPFILVYVIITLPFAIIAKILNK